MSSDIAIRVDRLGKCYQIYDKPKDRLMQSLWRGRKQFYREFWALQDISFEVRRGETVGVIGRNGSGKSTLLQLICGTLTPTVGKIQVNGRIAALLELGAGFNPEFTGRENVYLNAEILGLTREEVDDKYDDIAEFADIGSFLDQPVKTYSSGMYVRLAFAVAAHVDADILVIDEALAVGDAFFTQKCIRFLRKFREQGTLLFVSHDSASVVNLCHEAIWLEKGKMRIQASAKDVCEAYLAAFYEEQQGPSTIKASSKESTKKQQSEPLQKIIKDQRLEYINLSHHRNDIQVFGFDVNAPAFGKGGAQIVNVLLVSEDGAHLSWVVGGELVTVVVCVEALQDIYAPIVGFIVKDRLGQALFSDNTFLTYTKNPVQIGAGTFFEARFTFQMPILPGGDYVIAVSVAEGTQVEHIQHHWMHDALVLKSHSSSVCTGLVGIPMLDIKLNRVEMSEVSSTV